MFNKMIMSLMLVISQLSLYAVTINVTQTACTNGLPGFCDALQTAVNNELGADLPDVGLNKYSSGIANSNAYAISGQTSEYADQFSLFVLKPSFGLAVSGDINNPESADGFGLAAGLTVGLNLNLLPIDKLGPIEFKKLNAFITFMSYSVDQNFDQTNVKGDLSSFALMFRYQLYDTISIVPGHLVEWGGVQIHTGIQRSSFELKVRQGFDDQIVSTTVSSQPVSGTFTNTSVNFGIDSAVTTIPIEVSTSIRLGYIFTLYSGLGMDLGFGDATVNLNASGTVGASDSGSGSNYAANITADEKATGSVDSTGFRGFLGAQFNIPFFRIYAHVNKGLSNDLLGANLGVKILW